MQKTSLSVAVGNRIIAIRNELGFNQEELADRLGVDRTYVCKLENGTQNLTIMNLCKICEKCNVTIKEFFVDDVFNTYFLRNEED